MWFVGLTWRAPMPTLPQTFPSMLKMSQQWLVLHVEQLPIMVKNINKKQQEVEEEEKNRRNETA